MNLINWFAQLWCRHPHAVKMFDDGTMRLHCLDCTYVSPGIQIHPKTATETEP